MSALDRRIEQVLRRNHHVPLPDQIMFLEQEQVNEIEQLSERDLERILRQEARDWRG